jgi:hypothetical protein
VSIVESTVVGSRGKQSALVLGSGAGLTSFMLTRTFQKASQRSSGGGGGGVNHY